MNIPPIIFPLCITYGSSLFFLKSPSTGYTLISIKESPGAQWPLLQTPKHLARRAMGNTEPDPSTGALLCSKDGSAGGVLQGEASL